MQLIHFKNYGNTHTLKGNIYENAVLVILRMLSAPTHKNISIFSYKTIKTICDSSFFYQQPNMYTYKWVTECEWLLHNIRRTGCVEKPLLLFSTPYKVSKSSSSLAVCQKDMWCTFFFFHIDDWRMTEWKAERQIMRPSFWLAAENGTEKWREK